MLLVPTIGTGQWAHFAKYGYSENYSVLFGTLKVIGVACWFLANILQIRLGLYILKPNVLSVR